MNETKFIVTLTSQDEITPEMRQILAPKIERLLTSADEDHELIRAAAYEAFEGKTNAGQLPVNIATYAVAIGVEEMRYS